MTVSPSVEDIWPLTPLQEGLLFHSLFVDQGRDLYTVQVSLRLPEAVDLDRLQRAITSVVSRHSALRSAFVLDRADEPVQVVLTSVDSTLNVLDISNQLNPEFLFAQWREVDRALRFDLTAPPLFQFTLVRLAAQDHALILTHHHAVLDGWSINIVLSDVLAVYDDEPIDPSPDPGTFARWVFRQRGADAVSAWTEQLRELRPLLLSEGVGSSVPDGWPLEEVIELTDGFSKKIAQSASDAGVTTAVTMKAAFAVALGMHVDRADAVFCTVVSGRDCPLPGADKMVGLMMNTVPVTASWSPTETWNRLLDRIQRSQAESAPYASAPLAEIQRHLGHGTLTDACIVFANYPSVNDLAPRRHALSASMTTADATNFTLTLEIDWTPALRLRFRYWPTKIGEADVRKLAQQFVHCLSMLTEDCNALISLPSRRVDGVGAWGSGSVREFPQSTLSELFEQQAADAGDAVALVSDDHTLTYREVNDQANRLARLLLEEGVGPEQVVAVLLPRTPEAIVAILAIWKAGAAYVPVDPRYPRDRIRYVTEDSGAAVVIATQATAGAAALDSTVLMIDDLSIQRRIAAQPHHDLGTGQPALDPSRLAYVLYTSGSTGRPKGVLIEHRGVVNYLHWLGSYLGLTAKDRTLLQTALSFDMSISECFAALIHGASVYVAPPDSERDPDALRRIIDTSAVTVLHFVPSALRAYIAQDPNLTHPHLRHLISAGEKLPADLARACLTNHQFPLHNLYGPTEATVVATFSSCSHTDNGDPPIGRPIYNTEVYILDEHLEPVTAQTDGDLYLAGTGLARGYLNRPDLTASRFVANPFGDPGSRMYRTGDRARWNIHGELEFRGRLDNQVKIRGFRIELDEIEAALRTHPLIHDAVVTTAEDLESNGPRLVAHVVVPNREEFDDNAIRSALRKQLPAFMLPSEIVQLEEMPLTESGKVDRRQLRVPIVARDLRASVPGTGVASNTDLVVQVFSEVLRRRDIGPDDDFFHLGGDSLMATRVMNRLKSLTGTRLQIAELFEAPTAAELATRLEHTTAS
jgi:amino acid adenylation domain-containing protein